jgi:preprotein translocase subunit SecA
MKKELGNAPSLETVKKVLLDIARVALETEKEHLMRTARELIEKTEETYDTQRKERIELVDTYYDGIAEPDENGQPRKAQQLLDELSSLIRIPIRLQGDLLRTLPEGNPQAKDAIEQQIDATLIGTTVARLVGAFERRLDESLDLKPAELAVMDWATVAEILLKSVESHFDRRTERLLGSTSIPNGEIGNNVNNLVSRYTDKTLTDQDLLLMLTMISRGMRVQIDSRTHQRGWRRVILLNYFFMAARSLQDERPEDTTEAIINHLEDAQKILQGLYGQMELDRLTQMGATLPILDARLRAQFEGVLGKERTQVLGTTPLAEIAENEKAPIATVLGWQIQNDIYRNILLSSISELWVDYLTRIEAVRISISMESYAQRDPLVQYKSKATDLFKDLFSDIRQGVISRMFLLQPRRTTQAPQGTGDSSRQNPAVSVEVAQSQPTAADRKKKRHRH